MRVALWILAATLAYGCAPSVLRSEGPISALTPNEASTGAGAGERVRWGGVIAATNPQESETCIDVISKPLDARYRPRATDETFGRFRACAGGFYDPGIYEAGRSITVVGSLRDTVRVRVGEHELNYPVVAAEAVYLWKPPEQRVYYPYPVYWYGYPGWWGFRSGVYRAY